MTGEVSFSVRDYSNEVSSHRIDIADLTSANFDTYVGASGLVPDYYDALNAIVLGNISRERITARNILISSAPAGSVYAQVELKWQLTYTDAVTGKQWQREIPTPDLTLLVAGTDLMNITAGAGLAYKTAFEAVAVSPDGNAVTLNSVRVVGRNL